MAKKPKARFSPYEGRPTPRVGDNPPNYDVQCIQWRTSSVDMDGPYGWQSICRVELLKEIIDKLHNLATQRYMDCIGPGKSSHAIPVEKLSKEAQQRLEEIERDDLDQLISIRISGRKRIFAIRDKAVLHLLWWDPEHTVCTSHKKHT